MAGSMPKLKCYYGNYDGMRDAIVLAPSKKRAAEIIGTSLYGFNQYFYEQSKWDASLKPETLYTRSNNDWRGPWIEGRCEIQRRTVSR